MSTLPIVTRRDVSVIADVRAPDGHPIYMAARHPGDRAWGATSITARADVRDDGSLGSIYLHGRGHYFRKDGTLGKAPATVTYGRLSDLPVPVADALEDALALEAAKITVTP